MTPMTIMMMWWCMMDAWWMHDGCMMDAWRRMMGDECSILERKNHTNENKWWRIEWCMKTDGCMLVNREKRLPMNIIWMRRWSWCSWLIIRKKSWWHPDDYQWPEIMNPVVPQQSWSDLFNGFQCVKFPTPHATLDCANAASCAPPRTWSLASLGISARLIMKTWGCLDLQMGLETRGRWIGRPCVQVFPRQCLETLLASWGSQSKFEIQWHTPHHVTIMFLLGLFHGSANTRVKTQQT